MEIRIDSSLIYNSRTIPSSFNLAFNSNNEFETHILKISIFSRSGTGSLADKWDKEIVVYEYLWQINVYNLKSFFKNPLRFVEENGKLKVSWRSIPNNIAKNVTYSVEKNYVIDSIGGFSTIYSSSQSDTSFFDETYVGEEAKYRFAVRYTNLIDQKEKYISSDIYLKKSELPVFSYTMKGNTLEISWNELKYKNSISEITFSKSDYYFQFQDTSIHNYNSNILEIKNFPLCVNETFKIIFHPKSVIYYNRGLIDRTIKLKILTADTTFKYAYAVQGENDIIYYIEQTGVGERNLFKYSLNSRSILQKTLINPVPDVLNDYFKITHNKKYLSFLDGAKRKLGLIKNGDLSNITYYDLNTIISRYDDFVLTYDINDDGKLAASIGSRVFIYDLINNELLYIEPNFAKEVAISNDSKYVIATVNSSYNSLFTFENSKLKWVSNFNGTSCRFDKKTPNLFYYIENGRTRVYDCQTLTSKEVFKADYYYLDFDNSRAIFPGFYISNIVDLNTFQTIASYKYPYLWDLSGSRIFGNYIYFTSGTRWKFI